MIMGWWALGRGPFWYPQSFLNFFWLWQLKVRCVVIVGFHDYIGRKLPPLVFSDYLEDSSISI
jgi:hypothetical protein